jgi:hypothetical protein
MRLGNVRDTGLHAEAKGGIMASRNGKPMATPMP